MKVADVMTREVISASPDDTMRKIARLMLQYEISGFPVLERGRLVGIVSEGDFLRRVETGTERRRPRWIEFLADPERLAAEYAHAHARRVGDVMTRDVVTITADAPLEDAVRLMEKHGIKRLPVVAGATVIGMLSRTNLLRAVLVAAAPPTAVAVDDATIRAQIDAELKKQPWVPQAIVVTVTAGVVELHGVVHNERQRAALLIACENIPGVKQVRDALRKPGAPPPGAAI
jgi:CBS domain-containing protein